MVHYRRVRVTGGTYFFTVNCLDRTNSPPLIANIKNLISILREVKSRHPFEINAMVVLPDHFHAIWSLPPGDDNYSKRMRLIKSGFSMSMPVSESRSVSRRKRGERGVWQRRYWEHVVRDEIDLNRHIDYIHYNPVKHGWVQRVQDWPYSSFHRFVGEGVLPIGWGGDPNLELDAGE